jgi:hypothetical protein
MKNRPEPFTKEKLSELLDVVDSGNFPADMTLIQALEFSLAKWHASRDGQGDGECGLCAYDIDNGSGMGCNMCPIGLGSRSGCGVEDHPYSLWDITRPSSPEERAAADVLYNLIYDAWEKEVVK